MEFPSQKTLLGSLSDLEAELEASIQGPIFLVCDAQAFISSGAREKTAPFFARYRHTTFDGFAPYFSLEDVRAGLQQFQASNAQTIIGIGGGTAIDMAKLIKAFGERDANRLDIADLSCNPSPVPIVAVPTTAGSGSEATHFAVVYDKQHKYSVADPVLRPAVAVIDPSLLLTLPRPQRVAAGLDAFAQGIESYWAVGASPASQAYASQAIKLAWGHLRRFADNPEPASAEHMARAANLAGKAINLSKTTASHAISYAISLQHNVPHGIAVGLTLHAMMRHNAGVSPNELNDKRGCLYVQTTILEIAKLLGFGSVETCATAIKSFFQELTNTKSAVDFGIVTQQDRHRIAAAVNIERLRNNPRLVSTEHIMAMLAD